MINNDYLILLIQSGQILINPAIDISTVKNGAIDIHLDNYGVVLSKPTLDAYDADPREILLRINTETVPVDTVDLDTYLIYYGRNIYTRSLESITLPPGIFGVLHLKYGLMENINNVKVDCNYVLPPGFASQIYFTVTNQLEFPIVLEHGRTICELSFYQASFLPREIAVFSKKGRAAAGSYIPYVGLEFPDSIAMFLMRGGKVSRLAVTYDSAFTGTARIVVRKMDSNVWRNLGNVGVDVTAGGGGVAYNNGLNFTGNDFSEGQRLGIFVESKTGSMALKNVSARLEVEYGS